MKHLRTIWYAVVVSAFMVVLGVNTASATEIYSGNTTLPTGSEFHVDLASGASAVLSTTDGSSIVQTCAQTTGKGVSTNQSGASISINISSLTAGECSFTTDTLTNGSLTITHITGTDNGTVTAQGSVQTINIGISCRYGTGGGTHIGTLVGKTGATEHATIAVNTVINEQDPKQFLCPDTTRWSTSYVVTSPTGFNVRAN